MSSAELEPDEICTPQPPDPETGRFDPAWRTPTVVSLAKEIVRHLNREVDARTGLMPLFADALEDAGCDNTALLKHCRHAPDHSIACWVLTLILPGTPEPGTPPERPATGPVKETLEVDGDLVCSSEIPPDPEAARFDPAWRTPAVMALAWARRQHTLVPGEVMLPLADNLEAAGCDNPMLLEHCRGMHDHCLNCWVLRFILADTPEPELPPERPLLVEAARRFRELRLAPNERGSLFVLLVSYTFFIGGIALILERLARKIFEFKFDITIVIAIWVVLFPLLLVATIYLGLCWHLHQRRRHARRMRALNAVFLMCPFSHQPPPNNPPPA